MDSKTLSEAKIYDVGRLEVRNMIMQNKGAIAPVCIGGKLRGHHLYRPGQNAGPRTLRLRRHGCRRTLSSLFFRRQRQVGHKDIALKSNSMFMNPEQMVDIPLFSNKGMSGFLNEIADPKDSSFIQTNVVLVNGRREVYIPVFRQVGASTLTVVDTLKDTLPEIKSKLSESDVNLKVVMDQSVYVRASISALVQERIIGAVLCSLVILVFLGQWRMTFIAVLTLPLACIVVDCRLIHLRPNDQHDDVGRLDAGDRSDDRQRDHVPGKHASPFGHGGDTETGGSSTATAKWRCPNWFHALHVSGSDPLSPGAWHGAISVLADDDGGGVCDDDGLFAVAHAGSLPSRVFPEEARS